MNWLKVYLIEMADLETRWMEIMENVNGKEQQFTPQRSPAAYEAGDGDSTEASPRGGGGLDSLDLDDAAFPVGMCTRTIFSKAEIVLETDKETVDESVQKVLRRLGELGLI